MVNMYRDISILCFVDFMYYKLVNEKGNGRIESSDKARTKQHGNCHFHRPAGAAAGLLEGRGIATPEFHNAKR